MFERWENELPAEYRGRVVLPVRIERHMDAAANAEKILGLDQNGNRCFYFHAFTLTDERFDIDELPVLVDVYYECVAAWRLRDGLWLRLKSFADRLEHCSKRLTVLAPELTRRL